MPGTTLNEVDGPVAISLDSTVNHFLEPLLVGDVEHDNADANDLSREMNRVEIRESVVHPAGISRGLACDLDVGDRHVGIDHRPIPRFELWPTLRDDLLDGPAHLVLDASSIDRSKHRIDANHAKVTISEAQPDRRSQLIRVEDGEGFGRRLICLSHLSLLQFVVSVEVNSALVCRVTRGSERRGGGCEATASVQLRSVQARISIADESLRGGFGAIESGVANACGDLEALGVSQYLCRPFCADSSFIAGRPWE